jgi:hypothetical protein
MNYSDFTKCLRAGAIAFALSALATMAAPPPAAAQSGSLQGTWSGGGKIVFPSGESERARCRATFRAVSGRSFTMSAVCATASTRVQQNAEITRIAPNRYRGEFFNQEFGISGSARITLVGQSLRASLVGGGGSAEFTLSR